MRAIKAKLLARAGVHDNTYETLSVLYAPVSAHCVYVLGVFMHVPVGVCTCGGQQLTSSIFWTTLHFSL